MSQYHYYEGVLRTLIWLQFSRAIMGTNGVFRVAVFSNANKLRKQ